MWWVLIYGIRRTRKENRNVYCLSGCKKNLRLKMNEICPTWDWRLIGGRDSPGDQVWIRQFILSGKWLAIAPTIPPNAPACHAAVWLGRLKNTDSSRGCWFWQKLSRASRIYKTVGSYPIWRGPCCTYMLNESSHSHNGNVTAVGLPILVCHKAVRKNVFNEIIPQDWHFTTMVVY
jgi:hypothetical protein